MDTPFSDLDLARSRCSLARALDVLGDRWTLLVLREAFFGVARFTEFERRLGISRSVLTERLGSLVERGVLEKRPYEEPGQRTRLEYVLTHKGLGLAPSLAALMEWGDRYAAAPQGPPVRLVEAGTDHPIGLAFVRRSDRREVALEDVRARMTM